MNNRIVVIGDSFATRFQNKITLDGKDIFWVDELSIHFPNYEVICDGQGGIDTQTIIDNWIKVTPNLTKDDLVILFLPHMSRTRVSLEKSAYFEVKSKNEDIKITNRFVSPGCYFNQPLEIWDGEGKCSREFLFARLGFQSLIMASKAMLDNICEVMSSIIKLSKNRVYIFSWDHINCVDSFIFDKQILEKELGIWETLDDVYKNTSGSCGAINDHHWSSRTNKLFGEFLIKLIQNDE